MQADRTTKTLLFLIAAGLWGILLRSVFAPQPSIAQGLSQPVRLVATDIVVPIEVRAQRVPVEIRPAKDAVIPVEVRPAAPRASRAGGPVQ